MHMRARVYVLMLLSVCVHEYVGVGLIAYLLSTILLIYVINVWVFVCVSVSVCPLP